MTDVYTGTPGQKKVDEMLAAHVELHRRVAHVLTVIHNVLVKKPDSHRPAALSAAIPLPDVTRIEASGDSVVLHSDTSWHRRKIAIPSALLAAPDRDIARWTRTQMRTHLRNSLFARLRNAEREVRTLESEAAKVARRLEHSRALHQAVCAEVEAAR